MLSMVKDNHDLFESKFNNQVTNRKKNDKWNEIARVLSAMEVEVRDVAEILKKWRDLKSKAVEDFPRTPDVPTGGGPRPDVGPYSLTILNIIGDDSPTVVGIEGVESGVPTPQVEGVINLSNQSPTSSVPASQPPTSCVPASQNPSYCVPASQHPTSRVPASQHPTSRVPASQQLPASRTDARQPGTPMDIPAGMWLLLNSLGIQIPPPFL